MAATEVAVTVAIDAGVTTVAGGSALRRAPTNKWSSRRASLCHVASSSPDAAATAASDTHTLFYARTHTHTQRHTDAHTHTRAHTVALPPPSPESILTHARTGARPNPTPCARRVRLYVARHCGVVVPTYYCNHRQRCSNIYFERILYDVHDECDALDMVNPRHVS